MSLQVEIASVDRTAYVVPGSLTIPDRINQRSEAGFQLVITDGAWRPNPLDPVNIWVNETHLFAGFVWDCEEWRLVEKAGDVAIGVRVRCVDLTLLTDRRVIADSFDSKTCGEIVRELVGNYLAGDGVSPGHIQEGPDVTRVVFNYVSLTTCLNDLAEYADFYWGIKPGASTNLLTPHQASFEEAAIVSSQVYPGTDTTLSLTSSDSWDGSQCLQVTVGAATMGVFVFTAKVPGTIGDVFTASCYVKNPDGGVVIQVYEPDGGLGTQEPAPPSSGWQRISTSHVLQHHQPRVVIEVYNALPTPQTFYVDGFKLEKGTLTDWTAGKGPTMSTAVEPPRLDFVARATEQAPWTVNDTQEISKLRVRRQREGYRNRQFIRAGNDTTSSRTENFVGDGTRKSFTLAFPVGSKPTIKVNDVAKEVGIRGLNQSGYDWYWTKGDNVINQDDSATPLSSSDALAVTYRGLFPILVQMDNTSEQTERASVESTTGIYEAAETANEIDAIATAQQLATARLNRYAQETTEVAFQTLKSGLKAGQLLYVYMPAHDLDSTFLIEEIMFADRAGLGVSSVWSYQVKAVSTTNVHEWMQFWRKSLSQKQGGIRENEIVQQAKAASDGVVVGDSLARAGAAPVTTVDSATVGYSEVGA